MEERRIKLRRHIQAARAWLLQADKSLERENDVQGDLKLMLAKAELEQVHSPTRVWLKKLVPPLTALTIAAAAFFHGGLPFDQEVEPIETQPIASKSSEMKEADGAISMLEETVRPDAVVEMPIAPTEEAPLEEYSYEPSVEEYSEPTYYESNVEPSIEEAPLESWSYEPSVEEYSEPEYYEYGGASNVEEFPSESYSYEPAAAVPNEDIQQLMLDAGQILRAK